MGNQNNIREVIKGHLQIPVVTFTEHEDPISLMHYLLEKNIKCIEVTLRTPEGLQAIEMLKKEFGNEVLVGAGTVIKCTQVDKLKAVGADFIVSPGLTPDLHRNMEYSNIPYLPGVSTPSEIIGAQELGMNTLKFFPANVFGGLDTLKAYGQVFPQVKFCPTGGITDETSSEYLALSNVISVGGTWFQKNYQSTILSN